MIRKFAILLLLAMLAACGSDDAGKPKEEAPPKPPKVRTDNLICPQVAILEQAQETFDYAGETPDPAQLVAKARLQKVDGDCAYRKNGIDIAFTLEATSERGPRLGGSQASFPYFIAVIDPSEGIMDRQLMTASFAFSGDDKVAADEEKLHVFIPLPETSLVAGPDYRVLVGLQMNKK